MANGQQKFNLTSDQEATKTVEIIINTRTIQSQSQQQLHLNNFKIMYDR